MIKYAGAPQLGDYVTINNSGKYGKYVRLVTSIIANIDQPIVYRLDNGEANWGIDELTVIKPTWNIGELVRYKGKVHQVLITDVKNYKFVYNLENINQWIAEDELEYVNDVKKSVSSGSCIKVNRYCIYDNLRGREGKIDAVENLGADCLLDSYSGLLSLPWEGIDIIEEKAEPYNAELICIKGDGAWKIGELAKVMDNHFCFIDRTGAMCYEEKKVYNLNDVNDLYAVVRFAEIKETIGDKAGWNGKLYVADTTADGPLKVGNVYVVKDGMLNVGGCFSMQLFTSFEDIQERFDYATLIEVKE